MDLAPKPKPKPPSRPKADVPAVAPGVRPPIAMDPAPAHTAAPHLAADHVAQHPPARQTAPAAQAPHAALPPFLPALVALGHAGSAVKMLQLLLHKHGIDCGPIDGIFGPLTHAGVLKFQLKVSIEADGVVGPHTWGQLRVQANLSISQTDGVATHAAHPTPHPTPAPTPRPSPIARPAVPARPQPTRPVPPAVARPTPVAPAPVRPAPVRPAPLAPSPARVAGVKPKQKPKGDPTKDEKLRQEVVRVAGLQVGTLESGENRGGALKYQRAFGRGPEPWCADFVSWVMTQAGMKTNMSSCYWFMQKLKQEGRWKGKRNAQAGDIVFFDWDGDGTPDHVGIVKQVHGDRTISTIEGNTYSQDGGPQGVWERRRDRTNILGFGAV